VFPVLPLVANVSLGVGALSYAEQFNIMVVADRNAFPDLEVFASYAEAELSALVAGPVRDFRLARPVRPALSALA